MPLRYRIRRESSTRFIVEPICALPTWSFELPAWMAADDTEVLAEADMTRPCGLAGESDLFDLSDVLIAYTLVDSNAGTSSVRS